MNNQTQGPLHLTSADFDTALSEAGSKPVLVDFYADWCGPCKMIAPIVEELSGEYAEKAVITKVDVDAENELARRFGVMSIPTMIIFKNGQPVDKLVGYNPKSVLTGKLDAQM